MLTILVGIVFFGFVLVFAVALIAIPIRMALTPVKWFLQYKTAVFNDLNERFTAHPDQAVLLVTAPEGKYKKSAVKHARRWLKTHPQYAPKEVQE